MERRVARAWVHEDDVMMVAGLEPRKNCAEDFGEARSMKMKEWWESHGRPDSIMRCEAESSCSAHEESLD